MSSMQALWRGTVQQPCWAHHQGWQGSHDVVNTPNLVVAHAQSEAMTTRGSNVV